jgi:DNA (cytosine-5)-methyltransferase 1
VLLENVRNLAGPRHIHEWEVIIKTLRDLGYRVSTKPMVVSPHLIRPEFGGRPQVRDRVFIAATRIPKGIPNFKIDVDIPSLEPVMKDWKPQEWNLGKDLPLEKITKTDHKKSLTLSESEQEWIEAWNDFVLLFRNKNIKSQIPGFPIWADDWVDRKKLRIPKDTPDWKRNFLVKNADFYTGNKKVLDKWLKKWKNLESFPPSRRKFEWQAQDANSLLETIMHFRPSGIRAKKATYVPALVAITQTSIIGKQLRRISTREGARLQGLPEWFDFADQPNPLSYKQLGNGVNVGAVYNVIKAQVLRDIDLLTKKTDLIKAVLGSPASPDSNLKSHKDFYSYVPAKEIIIPEEYGQLKLIK